MKFGGTVVTVANDYSFRDGTFSYQRVDRRNEGKGNMGKLGVVVYSEAIVESLVQPLSEGQEHLAQTLTTTKNGWPTQRKNSNYDVIVRR